MNLDASTIMRRSLAWGGAVAAGLLLVAGAVGWLVAEGAGLAGAVVAVAVAAVFLGLTAVSIIVGNRLAGGRGEAGFGVFFGMVAGGWLVKLVAFLGLIAALRGADWLQPQVFGATLVVAVVGMLAVDVAVLVTSRPPDIDVPAPPIDGADDA